MDIAVRQNGELFIADWGAGARRCAVGRSGIGIKQREGDGITPIGKWPLRRVLFRADRLEPPRTVLPVEKSNRMTPGVTYPGIPITTGWFACHTRHWMKSFGGTTTSMT